MYNALIVACLSCGSVVLSMYAITGASVLPPVLIAVLYGFSYGATVSLIPPLAATLSSNVNEIGCVCPHSTAAVR